MTCLFHYAASNHFAWRKNSPLFTFPTLKKNLIIDILACTLKECKCFLLWQRTAIFVVTVHCDAVSPYDYALTHNASTYPAYAIRVSVAASNRIRETLSQDLHTDMVHHPAVFFGGLFGFYCPIRSLRRGWGHKRNTAFQIQHYTRRYPPFPMYRVAYRGKPSE